MARAREAAEAASRELEAFSYSVAHDLRTPLRSIAGFSHVLLEDYADALDDKGRDHLRHVCESAQRMGELIDSLLMLARMTRSELVREPVDVTGIAHAQVLRLRNDHPGREVDVVVAEGLAAEGDRRLLDVLIANLLQNAWKFTAKRARACIEVGTEQRAGEVVFFVRDDGAGFDMAYSAKLFGVFQRLHGANEFDGTGIGLATVQRIVHRHGGRIWAEGHVDRGATFYFTLGERGRL